MDEDVDGRPMRRRLERFTRYACVLLCVFALTPGVGSSTSGSRVDADLARPQLPVFRSGVQLMEVDAVATDAQGRPVMDLTKEEFELLDEGQRQEIAFFAAVSLPIQAPRPPVLRDVASNAFAEDGRLFVLVLDDIHSLRATTPVIKVAARRLVERLSPQDQVAVLWMSTDKGGAFEFTTNHSAVLAAIDDFAARRAAVERFAGSLFRDPEVEAAEGEHLRPPKDVQKTFERARPFNMIADLCHAVARIPRRRKAIVYVGQGPTGQLLTDHPQASREGLEPVLAAQAARRANVALYVIDPSGPLKPGAEGYLDEPGPLSFRDLARIRQDTMATFGMATGGFWGTGIRAVDLVDRIVTETSQYYLLGYYPPPPTSRVLRWFKEFAGNPWARFRSLEVRTTRPGVTIRARKGYWQDEVRPDNTTTGPVAAGTVTVRAVANVLPQSALPLRALAVPFRGDVKANVHPVAVAIEVTASPREGQPERAEVFAAAVEPGQTLRTTHRATATFRAEASRTPVSRYLLCERLDLKPGRYQLRLGVQSLWAQTTGSVYVDVTVPDYRKDALSMSGLVLDHQSSRAPMPAARTRTIADLVPALPSLARAFTAADAVWVAADIYRGPKAPAAPVEVVTAIGREGESDAVWHVRETFPPSAFAVVQKVRVRVPLPLATLGPGAYRLRVTATLNAPAEPSQRQPSRPGAASLTAHREMDITIEAR